MRDQELTLTQHLKELRHRVFYSVMALLIGSSIAFVFFRQLIELLVLPARDLNGVSDGQLIFTEVTEVLTLSVKVSLVAGFVLAFPVILYQIIMFAAPGLTNKERHYLLAFLPGALLAFAAGVSFAYFILTPPALHFLITFGENIATPLIRISNIVNLMIRLLFWMGVSFETPLIMYLLAQLGLVNAKTFSRFRRYWVVIAFILGAIITPTFDPLNQTLVAIPLLVLYELGILLAWLSGRGRSKLSTAEPPISRDN
jgi:sec-independent protein translocase protein TatC